MCRAPTLDHAETRRAVTRTAHPNRTEPALTTVNPTPDTAATVDAAEGTPRRELPRGLVWVLLILAVAANAGSSLFSLPIAVGVVFGVVALSLGALLVRDHYQRSPAPGAGTAHS